MYKDFRNSGLVTGRNSCRCSKGSVSHSRIDKEDRSPHSGLRYCGSGWERPELACHASLGFQNEGATDTLRHGPSQGSQANEQPLTASHSRPAESISFRGLRVAAKRRALACARALTGIKRASASERRQTCTRTRTSLSPWGNDGLGCCPERWRRRATRTQWTILRASCRVTGAGLAEERSQFFMAKNALEGTGRRDDGAALEWGVSRLVHSVLRVRRRDCDER